MTSAGTISPRASVTMARYSPRARMLGRPKTMPKPAGDQAGQRQRQPRLLDDGRQVRRPSRLLPPVSIASGVAANREEGRVAQIEQAANPTTSSSPSASATISSDDGGVVDAGAAEQAAEPADTTARQHQQPADDAARCRPGAPVERTRPPPGISAERRDAGPEQAGRAEREQPDQQQQGQDRRPEGAQQEVAERPEDADGHPAEQRPAGLPIPPRKAAVIAVRPLRRP